MTPRTPRNTLASPEPNSPGRTGNHALKIRKALRRLARPHRHPKTKVLPHPQSSPEIPSPHAPRLRLKKSSGAGPLGQIARALTENRPQHDIDARVATHIETHWRNKTPDTLTPGDITALRQFWIQTLAPSTIHGYCKALRRFLTYVDTEHKTHFAPLVPRLPNPQPRKNTCTDTDFAALLQHSPAWLRIFLLLCRCLGLRHEEARAITPAHFNEESQTLIFHRKDNGTSDLPLTPELLAAIRFCKTMNPTAPIVLTLGAPPSIRATRDAWYRTKKAAKVDPALIIHDLRRTAATRLYDQTRDLRLAQQFLGHKNLNATFSYLAPNTKGELAQAIANAAPVDLSTLTPATEVKQ